MSMARRRFFRAFAAAAAGVVAAPSRVARVARALSARTHTVSKWVKGKGPWNHILIQSDGTSYDVYVNGRNTHTYSAHTPQG